MIRKMSRFDYEEVCDLMTEFAEESTVKDLQQSSYDRDYAKQVLWKLEHSGICLVGEVDGLIQGMLLSLRTPDLWIPSVIRLREVAWYVRKNHRQSTLGARLFHEYNKQAREWLNEGKITAYTMTKLKTSPDFDYERRGFNFLEATYTQGA